MCTQPLLPSLSKTTYLHLWTLDTDIIRDSTYEHLKSRPTSLRRHCPLVPAILLHITALQNPPSFLTFLSFLTLHRIRYRSTWCAVTADMIARLKRLSRITCYASLGESDVRPHNCHVWHAHAFIRPLPCYFSIYYNVFST
jgi:hypothetical protein